MSGIIIVMISEELVRSRRALRLGTKPSSLAARRTATTRSGETLMPLKTRDTVAGETPARAATS